MAFSPLVIRRGVPLILQGAPKNAAAANQPLPVVKIVALVEQEAASGILGYVRQGLPTQRPLAVLRIIGSQSEVDATIQPSIFRIGQRIWQPPQVRIATPQENQDETRAFVTRRVNVAIQPQTQVPIRPVIVLADIPAEELRLAYLRIQPAVMLSTGTPERWFAPFDRGQTFSTEQRGNSFEPFERGQTFQSGVVR